MANSRRTKPSTRAASARTIHRIKVTLAGSRPPISPNTALSNQAIVLIKD